MDKVVASPRDAVADIADGATLAVGASGSAGCPSRSSTRCSSGAPAT
ncbi:hypothetical protein U6N30_16030 [Blastococcus brunescens]|uniref:Uncharacterized protein n=1 Tax=Blastococcus brunescens TaxID=1564165 RepID=A0ABZ1BAX7_9ACTN|nr:hypothetical protein [Blastococcus sp. BMG 8361]WRL66754.1 hypothetical protein U6N30_16030 [Blastococcus sp. BMG 8361]